MRNRELFQYSPLNRGQQTLRLVRIKPGARTLHLEMRHTTVQKSTDKYRCVSYVWGEPGLLNYVWVNNRILMVKQNLWDFLKAVHLLQRTAGIDFGWLWIDAISIDQSNFDERNHQVQHMATIYSSATEVIAWLGISTAIATFLWKCRRGEKQAQPSLQPRALISPRQHKLTLEDYKSFRASRYWDRAWITQEIALARNIVYVASFPALGPVYLDMALLPVKAQRSHDLEPSASLSRALPTTTRELLGESIIYLLDVFKSKKCRVDRDRIYSLLGICDRGWAVRVDYKTSPEKLMKQVLDLSPHTICFCAVRLLSRVLGATHVHAFHRRPYAEISVPYSRIRENIRKQPTLKPKAITTIALAEICSRAKGYVVILSDVAGYHGIWYLHPDRAEYCNLNKVSWNTGCTMKRSVSGAEYIISLSLEVLLELSLLQQSVSGALRPGFECCVRVRRNGRSTLDRRFDLGTRPVLNLCSKRAPSRKDSGVAGV
jgi:hypothetical protein